MEHDYKVIALFDHKGGLSKTTTTFNLGWSLAKKKKRVLMIDGDPQCNLTGMALAFNGLADLETLYDSEKGGNIFGALQPAFEAAPERIKAAKCIEVTMRPDLFFLPGHVSVAEYEFPLGVAHELSGRLGVMKNLPGAVNTLIKETATELKIDYVLIDMSSVLSALNQNLFMTSTHFIMSCNPDYFCSLAFDGLTKVLPKWASWPKRAQESGVFEGAAYPIPVHTPRFLGTINQRVRLGYGASARAFQTRIDHINERVKSRLIPVLKENKMLLAEEAYKNPAANSDPYSLIDISDFNAVIAQSQATNIPVFELTENDFGFSRPGMLHARNSFTTLFLELADSVMAMTAA